MSPPRPGEATGYSAPHVVEKKPLRHPDGTRETMTRRGWWLVILNFLLPGSAQAVAGNRRLGKVGLGATLAMWALAILNLVALLLWRTALVSFYTGAWIPDPLSWFRPVPLLLLQGLLIAYAVLWVVLTIDTLRLVRLVRTGPGARFGIAGLSVALLVVAGGGAVSASQYVGTTRDTLGAVFGQSGPSVPPSDGYYNVLLLGADSGAGRDSMRFDSISVVSVNADTGAVTITGIPRDMPHAPFPEDSPMHAAYPEGLTGHDSPTCAWGSGINQLMNAVEVCSDDRGASLYPDAAANGSRPAVEATKDAAEGILGIEIPYYVFLDMKGFADLVDALGGVDITVEQRLPKGGGPSYQGQPAEDWAIGWIEAGPQHMDGDTAQWYARSRYTTNDWDRMKRQRQLQEAILQQFTPANVLTHFNAVAAAGVDIVQTDLPQSLLPYFLELAMKSKELPLTKIELTPEGGIDDQQPDFAYIRDLVRNALHPPTPTPEG
ncbi:LCP family protein [Microbacterium ulmi]|uniref:LCP family protein n=2 Tax=Microbacterium ulmi TaxID=179095 RepID=A0A7Y2LYW5_9MICO|nr:LCP family protein [Microbacterium ulmi]NNH03391.1 LCP family protein [Microbacterium ulmi]